MSIIHPRSGTRRQCCGHSEEAMPALIRYRCAQCDQIIGMDETKQTAAGLTHEVGGEACGPVRQECARSHAEYVAWLMGE